MQAARALFDQYGSARQSSGRESGARVVGGVLRRGGVGCLRLRVTVCEGAAVIADDLFVDVATLADVVTGQTRQCWEEAGDALLLAGG